MSDFGHGYATCLIQFANHRARLGQETNLHAEMAAKYPGEFPDRGAEMWANGASDHLYELVRPPRRGLTPRDWQDAKALATRALDIGHGFRPSSKSDPAECVRLLDETDRLLASIGVADLDAAMSWDRDHGLTPDRGEWACSEDLRR